jgi:transcriptional regulator with XRE-family HTH domain
MARTKQPPISIDDRQTVGRLLRDLRRAAGYRSVETASTASACPASRQTIYNYERAGSTPSLSQFLELVEFYVLDARPLEYAKPPEDLRAQGIAAVACALSLPVYHVPHAIDLIDRMQPGGAADA